MLEIIIADISVDLHKDIQLAITVENPLMTEDRIPAPYSLNFEIPPTPRNLKAFGFPDRIASYGVNGNASKLNKSCSIRFNSIEILKGHVVFLEFLTDIKLQFIGIDFNEYLKAPMNTLDIGRKYFPGSYNMVDFNNSLNFAYNYARWADELGSGSRGDMVAGPIVLVNENHPFTNYSEIHKGISPFGRFEYYQKKDRYKAQDQEYINMFNPMNGRFLLEEHQDGNNNKRNSHANIFPQFRIGYLFDAIFGNILLNNPFRRGYLYDLLLPTYYFSEWHKRESADMSFYNKIGHFPPLVSNPRPTPQSPYYSEPYIELNDFLPSVRSNDFVKSLLNLFCMTMTATKGKLTILGNSDILSADASIDWSMKISSTLNLKFETGKQYLYGYESKTDEKANISASKQVDDMYGMMREPYQLDETKFYENKFVVLSQIFKKEVQEVSIREINGTVNEHQINYSLEDNGFNFSVEKGKKESFNMVSTAIPLPMYPAIFYSTYSNEGPRHEWSVPGFKDIDRNNRPNEIYLTFFQGRRSIKEDENKRYPGLGGNLEKNTTGPNILSWDGEFGLFETYHKNFAEWIERDKVSLSATVDLNIVDLKNLNVLEKVHIRGRNFLIKKLQYTIGLTSISPINADFLEA